MIKLNGIQITESISPKDSSDKNVSQSNKESPPTINQEEIRVNKKIQKF